MPTSVVGVHSSPEHTFTKQAQSSIELVAGIGVKGDAHAGATVKHSYLLRKKPEKPNLRQVHLIASELIDELRKEGFKVERGSMGENITTSGVQLTSLPHGTRLVFASGAAIELTGIRTPCKQLNGFQDGLLAAVREKNESGAFRRPVGVLAVVVSSGTVSPNDVIDVQLPTGTHRPMEFI
jgi:MOSC domain-containing protein YiiM